MGIDSRNRNGALRLQSLLLAAGFLAGPVLGLFDPEHAFGDLLDPMIAIRPEQNYIFSRIDSSYKYLSS